MRQRKGHINSTPFGGVPAVILLDEHVVTYFDDSVGHLFADCGIATGLGKPSDLDKRHGSSSFGERSLRGFVVHKLRKDDRPEQHGCGV